MSQQIDIKYINKFTGYKNFRDVTNLNITDITAGSQNVFIEDGAKLSVRGGTDFLGAEGTVFVGTPDPYWTIPNRIHSNYDTFVNSNGNAIPIRVFYSGDDDIGDIFEAYLPVYSAGAVDTGTKAWYPFTRTVSVSQPYTSKHKWYFAEWWDDVNLQPFLVMTGGDNVARAWTGAYGVVTAVTPTTITIQQTFASAGFLNAAAGGSDSVIVNGKQFTVTGANYSTDTITVASSAGVAVNDLVFQNFTYGTYKPPSSGYQMDVCSMVNNQIYYIDWRQRNVFVSWNRNRPASLGNTIYQGTSGLDDALFTGTYTGTTTDTYSVKIDSTNPAVNTQEFTGTGTEIFFDTSGYTGTGRNKYILRCVFTQIFTCGTYSGTITPGEPIKGLTSLATGVLNDNPAAALNETSVQPLVGEFQVGETVIGQYSGATFVITAIRAASSVIFFKNDVQVPLSIYFSGNAILDDNGAPRSTPLPLVDGLQFIPNAQNTYISLDYGDYVTLDIDSGAPDTFTWTLNGVQIATEVPITGSAQTLSQGVSVTFDKTTGHKQGDSWTMTAYHKVTNGWCDLTFSQPLRYAGEGFKISLDTNGWTMQPQEKAMYINGQGGEWYEVNVQLSADLLSETLSVTRLKTEPKNKAIYPYTIGYMKNYFISVSEDKTFDILGRQKFLELPQAKSLSDEIRYDFTTADWEDATISYQDRKVFFTLPKQGIVLIYDEYKQYWHAPMKFARRISAVSYIDGKICGHSYERNETYELFTNSKNDLTEFPINTRIVFPYYDFGKRYSLKATSAFACDGYMEGIPNIEWKINFGVGGCDGVKTSTIDPIPCLPLDTASLGKSSLGFHGLGNSPTDVIPHFKYGWTFDDERYYLRNIELSSNAPEQRWSITSIGTNVSTGNLNNSNMFNINTY
jgi:hypothetical protein